MNTKPPRPTSSPPLRGRAETRLSQQSNGSHAGAEVARSHADTQRLLHELQVHQIELEMQNEELRKARDEMEAGLEKYSELYDFAPVGYLTLNPEGVIQEANLTAASLLGIPRAPLVKQRLRLFVTAADRPVFDDFLQQVFEGSERKECDVQLLGKDKTPVDVRIRGNLSEAGPVCRLTLTDITQHKLAEAATAQLAAIVTSSSDAIVGKDLNSIITSWNAGAEKLFGYSAGEIVGQSIARLIPSDRSSEEEEIISQIRKGESVVHFETVREAKDGRRIDMSVTISPIRHGGKIVGASKVARDITERKQAEDKVRISEIRYRRLFEAAHDGVLLIDPGTRKITDANPFMTKLLGYPRDQLVGKELYEIGLLKDETASQEMFRKLKRKHEVRYEDLPLESQQGRHQEVEVVANLYEENGQPVIQCNIRDITDRKESETALRQSEERYRGLFNSIDEGFCVIEMLFDKKEKPVDYRFSVVNPAFQNQTGITDAQGKRMTEITPDIEPHWLQAYGKVALTGKPVRFSNEMKGLKRWFDVYAFRLGGRESRRVAVLFNNITARKQVEQALREAQQNLSAYAGQLELMVAKRTAELTATNRRLKTAVVKADKSKRQYMQLFLESQLMQAKLRDLTRQILTAQEEERKEISRELHDQVVQALVGINVELSALGTEAAVAAPGLKDKIVRTQQQVAASVEAVHSFARKLRPAVLDDLGLIPALHAYSKNLAARQKLRIHLTAFGGVEALDGAKRTVLFRVAQEALTNVVRHARATAVKITITKIPGAIRMEISDNGRAFSVRKTLLTKTNKRLGLVGMRERIEMVGGSLAFDSVPGRGTTVLVELPFPPEKTKK